jgi:hypothetical protein
VSFGALQARLQAIAPSSIAGAKAKKVLLAMTKEMVPELEAADAAVTPFAHYSTDTPFTIYQDYDRQLEDVMPKLQADYEKYREALPILLDNALNECARQTDAQPHYDWLGQQYWTAKHAVAYDYRQKVESAPRILAWGDACIAFSARDAAKEVKGLIPKAVAVLTSVGLDKATKTMTERADRPEVPTDGCKLVFYGLNLALAGITDWTYRDALDPPDTNYASVAKPKPVRLPKFRERGANRSMFKAFNGWYANTSEQAAAGQALVTSQERSQAAFYDGHDRAYATQVRAVADYARRIATLIEHEPALTRALIGAFKRRGVAFSLGGTQQVRKLEQIAAHSFEEPGAARTLARLPGSTDELTRWMIATSIGTNPAKLAHLRFPDALAGPNDTSHAHQAAAALRKLAKQARANLG